jgi:hypothetical protein
MELLELLITLPQTVTVPAGATTGTVVIQLLILIAESNETFTIVWNSFGYGNNQ